MPPCTGCCPVHLGEELRCAARRRGSPGRSRPRHPRDGRAAGGVASPVRRSPRGARTRPSIEGVPEEGRAAAMSAEQALALAVNVRLAPPLEPFVGLPDGNFALDALDFTLSPIDFDLDPFDPWV